MTAAPKNDDGSTGRLLKGLDVASHFWQEWGEPHFKAHFPEMHARAAVGKMYGSDVLGADDEVSRDHCWGPHFVVWLAEDDFVRHGKAIEAAMNAVAPNPWKGYRLAGGGDRSVVVESIPRYFQNNLEIASPPAGTDAWRLLTKHESWLYFIRHGAIWHDGLGEMSAWRRALQRYPEPVRISRLADECFRVWHHGEYNFVMRMAKRLDPLAISICLGEFVAGVMRIHLILDGDFTPYWKWLAHEFRKSAHAARYAPLLDDLVTSRAIADQVRLVKQVCGMVHVDLLRSGVITGKDPNEWLLPLLNDHHELKRITAAQTEG
jgi:hypothetical protein